MGVNANDAASATSAVTSEGGVKYRLVEAEEVDATKLVTSQPPSAAGTRAPKTKAKGKTSWSQFPLDDAPATEQTSSEEGSQDRQRNFRGRGRGGRFGGNGGRGRGGFNGRRPVYDDNGVYYNGVFVPNTDLKVTAQWAKSQIEFYFSPDNLVRDMFLRQHMDVDGYVPLAFVGSFQAVYSVHQDYESLFDAVKESTILELDEENEKIRLRDNWASWLWPNGDGTYGVPRYIKLQEEESAQ
ncbi:hypothetical protein Poli38472_007646 [Pythium oligandrum]|uniref:HTH La-type RNA-binding domain-containing protein n=1 Tax=Pythium oligandrum TaxID=41045 RepID=A0A8K1CQY1_PYTOL|nr:hypothetical protein Poli38472_007646 [Pythium oligandrum]|eukprot:TMW67974.1 hypothetical protein Poli38472_007646 [Pythium oligandrum]